MKKRLLGMMLAMVVAFTATGVPAYATNNTPASVDVQTQATGNEGAARLGAPAVTLSSISAASGRIDNEKGGIDWSINSDGVLTVKGKGDIAEDNINGTLIPWSGKNFTSAVVELEDVTDLSYFFADCKYLESVDFSNTDTGFVTDMSYMFNDCWELKNLNLSGFDTADVENMQGMFSGCKNLRTVTWDRAMFDTSNVTNMNSMFMGCIHLTSVDFSGFNTSKVTDMSAMFRSCAKLVNLDLGSFDTSNVTTMANMFWECTALAQLNLGRFNTAKVTNMHEMFKGCSDLTELNVSSFDTSNVTDMTNMFDGCTDLKNLDLSSFDMSNITSVGTFIGGVDFWSEDNTALEIIRSPKNLKHDVTLPAAEGETWYKLGGDTVTALPKDSSDSVLIQKNKQPEKGLTLNVSDTSVKPIITIAFDGPVNLKSFSLKIDGAEVLGIDKWADFYNEATRKVIWQPEAELTEGVHTLELTVEDEDGNSLGTPVTKTFTVVVVPVTPAPGGGSTPGVDPKPEPDPGLPEGEIISKVVVVVNDNYIRVRAWSPYDNVESVQAAVVEKYVSGEIVSGNDTVSGNGSVYSMSMTNGYYTCLIPRHKEGLVEVTATVTATNSKGESHTSDPVVVAVDNTLDDKKVVNDLWIKFLDGNGAENNEYVYTGKAIKPAVEVYEGTRLLTFKSDYTLSYKNNKNAGTATLTVKGKGVYTKTATYDFKILPKDISNDDLYDTADSITIEALAAVQKSKVQKLVPVIKYGKMKLSNKKDKDFTVTYPDTEAGAYQAAGCWNVVVKGNGNYTGEITLDFNIGEKLAKSLKVSKIKPQPYNNGNPVSVNDLQVYDKKTLLTEGTDYEVSYLNNTEAGTATLVIEGIGPKYVGQKLVNFKIEGTVIKKAQITLPASVEYTGAAQTPEVKLTYGGKELVEDTDYNMVITNNINTGKATVQITGRGGFTGTVKKTFKITPFDVKVNSGDLMVIASEEVTPFQKSGAKPITTITFNGIQLEEGKDYKLSYAKNKAVGSGILKISFKKNFKGNESRPFTIEQQDISLLRFMTQDMAMNTKKNSWKSKVVVWDFDGKSLSAGKDFEKVTAYYEDEACTVPAQAETYPVGTELWVKVLGKGNYKGELIGSYEISPAVITKAKVKVAAQEYSGYAVELEAKDIEVKVAGQTLVADQDYRIVEDSYLNNVKKGKAQVVIEGIGNYGGTYTVKYTIGSKIFEWRHLPIINLFFGE